MTAQRSIPPGAASSPRRVPFSAVFTTTPTEAAAHDVITIQLNSSGNQANFDNVRFIADVPEPGAAGLVGLGLAGLLALAAVKRVRRA